MSAMIWRPYYKVISFYFSIYIFRVYFPFLSFALLSTAMNSHPSLKPRTVLMEVFVLGWPGSGTSICLSWHKCQSKTRRILCFSQNSFLSHALKIIFTNFWIRICRHLSSFMANNSWKMEGRNFRRRKEIYSDACKQFPFAPSCNPFP